MAFALTTSRHSSDRVSRLEALVETYKRKLEDLGDLRRQVRLLEERNTVYMQRTCELEEELRRANVIRSQLDTYKRQVSRRTWQVKWYALPPPVISTGVDEGQGKDG